MGQTSIKPKVKIVKKWRFSAFFSGLLALAMASMCVVMLFIPMVEIKYQNGGEQVLSITAMTLIANIFQGGNPEFIAYLSSLTGGPINGGLLTLIYSVVFIFMFVFYAVLTLVSVFQAIAGIEYFVRGRISDPHRIVSYGKLIFFNALMLTVNVLFLGIAFPMLTPKEALTPTINITTYIYAGGSLLLLVVICIVYTSVFKNCYYPNEVNYIVPAGKKEPVIVYSQASEAKPDKQQVQPVRKPMSKLPENISSIGGHAFAENLYIQEANIPAGISSLGEGAFANCGNLKSVYIPRSCKKIGTNCFFNCKNLISIKYGGTKREWKKIKRGDNWLMKAGTNKVITRDGGLIVDQLK